jgi:hypothetical protein
MVLVARGRPTRMPLVSPFVVESPSPWERLREGKGIEGGLPLRCRRTGPKGMAAGRRSRTGGCLAPPPGSASTPPGWGGLAPPDVNPPKPPPPVGTRAEIPPSRCPAVAAVGLQIQLILGGVRVTAHWVRLGPGAVPIGDCGRRNTAGDKPSRSLGPPFCRRRKRKQGRDDAESVGSAGDQKGREQASTLPPSPLAPGRKGEEKGACLNPRSVFRHLQLGF